MVVSNHHDVDPYSHGCPIPVTVPKGVLSAHGDYQTNMALIRAGLRSL